ncbi:protein yellow-like [Corticium candelabrum]|uniref:protein yellow-like n=1 Tax=Corticium candelabrum TaxID=121492 RepID=UPI002E26F86F|nr:protein yellow-like [Corticium candelabrum]
MSFVLIAVLVGTALYGCGHCRKVGDTDVIYEWVSLEYDWPDDGGRTRSRYEAHGLYVPHNNALAGIKIYKGTTYVTVPRWKHGVPSTLNKVVHTGHRPLLQPFPSWEMQELGNCDSLQYVQSMEIDAKCGWMWIIDAGRVNLLESPDVTGLRPLNLCPPKLVIYDLNRDEIVRIHVFTDAVASYNESFLNDIVVDRVHRFAYISDAQGSKGRGGIISYSFDDDKSRLFWGPSTEAEPDAYNIDINNLTYTFKTPSDGIALNQDGTMLYYCALSGYTLYGVSTELLRNLDLPMSYIRGRVQRVGMKVSQSDGLVFSSKRKLFFGVESEDAVYHWDKKRNAHDFSPATEELLVSNSTTMEWVDTFAFDEEGYLWFTSNRLDKFLSGEMQFSNPLNSNFRVIRVFVNDSSYLNSAISNFAQCPRIEASPTDTVEQATPATLPAHTPAPPVPFTSKIMYEWPYLEFNWPNEAVESLSKARGNYIQPNNIPMHVAIIGNTTFITVPRLKPGVPSTLNRLIMSSSGKHVLDPYPSWDMQKLGNCTALQSIEGIEIDVQCNQMWVIDSGRAGYLHHYSNGSGEVRVLPVCPPKVTIFNLTDGTIIKQYKFAPSTVSSQSQLCNVVLDKSRQVAYIANQGMNNNGSIGGLVVFDLKNNRARQVPTPLASSSPKIQVDDMVYNLSVPMGTHALALLPDASQVFFSHFGSQYMYSINTEGLLDFSVSDMYVSSTIITVGQMKSPSATMIFGNSWKLYYSEQSTGSVYGVDYSNSQGGMSLSSPTLLTRHNIPMEWPESLTFSNDGKLMLVTNKFHSFVTSDIACHLLSKGENNFYVWKIDINPDASYLTSPVSRQSTCPIIVVEDKSALAQKAVTIFTVVIACVLAVAIAVFLALMIGALNSTWNRSKKQERDAKEKLINDEEDNGL